MFKRTVFWICLLIFVLKISVFAIDDGTLSCWYSNENVEQNQQFGILPSQTCVDSVFICSIPLHIQLQLMGFVRCLGPIYSVGTRRKTYLAFKR